MVLENESVLIWAGLAAASVVGLARYQYYRWQESVERERFVLALKAAATPDRLKPRERSRLRLLRAPWWAVWRWLPDRFRSRETRLA